MAIVQQHRDSSAPRFIAEETEALEDATVVLRLATLIVGTAVVGALVVLLIALAFRAPDHANAAPQPDVRPHVVASFTTPFICCQPRVTNIRRAAELLDGTWIPAGGRFSMNAVLGQRTTARGFVSAPMISGGRLVGSVGGGISQVAATLYNAAFFAGLRLVAHTPHSFYISRYPMGREATISWGGPELIFENNWAAAIRMRLRVSSTAITVRFYSEPLGRRIQSWTGKPYGFRAPTTRIVRTPSLPLGRRRVAQEAGAAGFTVEYGRRVLKNRRFGRNEHWRVRYQPQDRIVEIGTR